MPSSLPLNTAELVYMGMRFTGEPLQSACDRDVDIESMILDITEVFPDDARLASVFLSWIKVHGNYVIVGKLSKLATKRKKDTRNENPWLSMAAAWAVEFGYHKWRKLVKKVPGPVYLYPKAMSEGAIKLKGNIPWLESLGFMIPVNSIRIREEGVVAPEKLIRNNLQYKNRYLYGPSWRADIVTAIQRGITSPTEISRMVGCSYELAYRISREFLMATIGEGLQNIDSATR